MNLEELEAELNQQAEILERIRTETKHSRMIWQMLSWVPMNPKIALTVFTGFTILVATITDIILRIIWIDEILVKVKQCLF